MYLFMSVFTTEKHYYFKVQFYWYLKEIISKENRMDLKYVPMEQIFFLNSWRKMIENVNEREGFTSGN